MSYVANIIRDMLDHFGCSNEHAIWGEFATAPYKIKLLMNEKYPQQPLSMITEKLTEKRAALARGEIPELGIECPLSQYE